ncbi:MAG: putative acetyltransferase, family [Bacteroidetes bacterium]|jgi:ribosomal protein S18 acetylase RimI-like enzyme|nr:putative acetyltransferase, family [Bacteroidota bacterium]
MPAITIAVALILIMGIFFLRSGKEKKFLNYRKAKPEELSKLRELGLLSYSQHKDVLGENWNTMEKNLKSDAFWDKLLGISVPFVCEDYNKIVGMAFLVPSGHPDEIYQADWSHIRMVGVDPAYSGKGISKKLTQMCIEQAKENGEKIITLHTSEFMNAARHVYEGLGFTIMKEIPPRFGKRYWLYKLDLVS